MVTIFTTKLKKAIQFDHYYVILYILKTIFYIWEKVSSAEWEESGAENKYLKI